MTTGPSLAIFRSARISAAHSLHRVTLRLDRAGPGNHVVQLTRGGTCRTHDPRRKAPRLVHGVPEKGHGRHSQPVGNDQDCRCPRAPDRRPSVPGRVALVRQEIRNSPGATASAAHRPARPDEPPQRTKPGRRQDRLRRSGRRRGLLTVTRLRPFVVIDGQQGSRPRPPSAGSSCTTEKTGLQPGVALRLFELFAKPGAEVSRDFRERIAPQNLPPMAPPAHGAPVAPGRRRCPACRPSPGHATSPPRPAPKCRCRWLAAEIRVSPCAV